ICVSGWQIAALNGKRCNITGSRSLSIMKSPAPATFCAMATRWLFSHRLPVANGRLQKIGQLLLPSQLLHCDSSKRFPSGSKTDDGTFDDMTTNAIYIDIRSTDFDQGGEYSQLLQDCQAGAIVTFVGRVRDFATQHGTDLWLEHYPGMTEKVLQRIALQAQSRWPVLSARIIHRVGRMQPGEQIVFVGVSAPHRHDAFHACMF